MKFVALIEKDMNGSYRQLKSRSWKRSRLYFDPEAIHIMVPGETEEEFDKRIESYEEFDNA